jgi:peptidoglycan hydrolase FlgJ
MKTNLDTNLLLSATKQTPDTQRGQKDKEALKKSCQDFEAIFVQSLFKAMRKTVPESGLFEKDTSTATFQDMLDQEIASKISRKQSVGLADQMYRQMEKNLSSRK